MKSKLVLLLLVLCVVATPVFAQDTAAAASGGFRIPNSLAMALASGLCALGQGRAIASSAEAIARNPSAGNVIRGSLVLGLAFIESLALFTLVIIFAGA